jgi:hypothetical protein
VDSVLSLRENLLRLASNLDKSRGAGKRHNTMLRGCHGMSLFVAGPQINIRSFHDEMLNGGTLPLDLLEARTDNMDRPTKS